jgi:hypothetical protein
MNASWNAFCPVAFMTVMASGGLLSKGIRYGAEAYQLLLSAALALCALTRPNSVAAPMAAVAEARETNDFRCTKSSPKEFGNPAAAGARDAGLPQGRRVGTRPERAGWCVSADAVPPTVAVGAHCKQS